MAVRLLALRAGRPLPPGRYLVLISVKRLSQPQSHSAAARIWSFKKSSDLIENRTSDLPACSVVPQPTTLARASGKLLGLFKTSVYQLRENVCISDRKTSHSMLCREIRYK
jgi:hypothetical protein